MPRCWKRPPTRWSSSWRWPGWRRPGRWRPRSRPGEAGAPPAERDEQHYAAALLLAAHDPASAFLPRKFWQNTRSRQVDGEWVRENGRTRRCPAPRNHHAAQFRHPAARGGGDRAGQGVAPSAAGHAHRHAGLGRCRCSAGPLRGGQGEWRAVPGGSDPGLAARAARTARARGRGHRRRVAADHRHLADRVAQPWVGNLEGRWLSAMGVVAPRDPRSPWKRLRPRSRR